MSARRLGRSCILVLLVGTGLALTRTVGAEDRVRGPLTEWVTSVEEQLARIGDEEAVNGPHSYALLGPLRTLAELYTDQGEYALAAAQLERALQIVRVNDGLNTLEQVPVIDDLLDNARDLADAGRVDELDRRLETVIARNLDDVRVVPILTERGDRHMTIYERHRAGELPAPVSIRIDQGPPDLRRLDVSTDQWFGLMNIAGARRDYSRAIGVLLRQELYEYPELIQLERKLLKTYYFSAINRGPLNDPSYALGVQTYQRILHHQLVRESDVRTIARTLVELGDWHLLFSHNGVAHDNYKQAYRLLADVKEAAPMLNELFTPDVPIVLPAFRPNPLNGAGSDGFVDLRFDVTRWGESRNVEIVDSSSDFTRGDGLEIRRLVLRQRFRPQFRDGDIGRSVQVSVRYGVAALP